jgi:dihydrodipicolinate synthase/N-acetylneuraminate lyase
MDANGKIDWLSLKALIERILPFSDGLLIGEPLVGEGLSLSDNLRLELFRGCLEAVEGRKPLILCPTAQSSEDTLKGVEAGEQIIKTFPQNSPVFWIDLPLWHHSNRKLPQFYEDWSQRTSLPLLLYNHPALITRLDRSLKRKNIRTAVLKKLSENERIVGLVQAGDFQRTLHYQRAVRMRRDFRVYDGDETNFLFQPSSSGIVSWGANLLPAEWREVAAGALAPTEDPSTGLRLFKASQKLKTLSEIMRLNPAAFLKYGLYRIGQVKEARLWKENQSLSPMEFEKMDLFLQENFSLQIS